MFTLYKKNKKFANITILFIILIYGIFLRFYNLEKQSYWMDEGYTINAILSTIENGTKNGATILDSKKTYFCPLYCLPSSIITKLNGENAWSYRFISALFGSIFIIFTYFLSKKFFKKESVALLTTFFISLSYWQIVWSRQARWYTMLATFFWLTLYSFYIFLKTKDRKNKIIYFIITIFLTILSIVIHRLAYLLPIILLTWYLIENNLYNNTKLINKNNKKIINKKIILALSMFIILIIFLEYGLNLKFITKASANIVFSYNLPYYLSFYLSKYWLFIILGIYGFFNAKQENKRKIIMLAIPLLLYLLFLSFSTKVVHYRYLFHTTIVFYILGTIGFIDILNKIKYNYLKLISLILLVLLFFITKNGIILPKEFYFLEADDPDKLNRPYYAYTPQPDFNKAYGFIKENIKNDEIIISSHPHFNKIFLNQPGYWIKYHYLGMEDTANQINQNKEYYVGAEIINNLEELESLIKDKSGYILFDYMSIDRKIDLQIINYINNNLNLVFYDEINSYSKIWIYKF